MVSFIVYDLVFLVLFTIVVIFLLHKDRKNLKRHGWVFLYHSKFGLKFIDWAAKKFERILKPLQYIVITSGYILMIFMVWLLSLSVWRYITLPIPEQLQNIPPIAPLIPYFPKLFGLDSIFPPLYFTYFLVALAIVAISHECSHGIFARLNNIKIKTTGLAFFGPFFGAFVEPDERQMEKKNKFPQLSILAAGTFANVVMTVIFLFVLWGFFSVSFAPAGVNFNTYPQAIVGVDSISFIENNQIFDKSQILDFSKEGMNEIIVEDTLYLVPKNSLERAIDSNAEHMIVFEDAPAVRAELRSPILAINGQKITSLQELNNRLDEYLPGEIIFVKTLEDDIVIVKEIELDLADDGTSYLGIGFIENNREGFVGAIFSTIQKIKDPLIYYEPSWDGDFVQFIYDLLWWIIVINILVALFNMLPVSILDGGRFFYLTIWGITGNEKTGKKAYSLATWFILLLLVLMMIRWLFVFIS